MEYKKLDFPDEINSSDYDDGFETYADKPEPINLIEEQAEILK
jgi:hypothetical protein